MNWALICLGSNTPEGEANIETCLEFIRIRANYYAASQIYQTEPEGEHRHAKYKNCVVQIFTTEPHEIWERRFKMLEQQLGRDQVARSQGVVPIDLDIISWNEEVIRPTELKKEYLRLGLAELSMR